MAKLDNINLSKSLDSLNKNPHYPVYARLLAENDNLMLAKLALLEGGDAKSVKGYLRTAAMSASDFWQAYSLDSLADRLPDTLKDEIHVVHGFMATRSYQSPALDSISDKVGRELEANRREISEPLLKEAQDAKHAQTGDLALVIGSFFTGLIFGAGLLKKKLLGTH